MIALHLARRRPGTLDERRLRMYGQALRSLPRTAAETLRTAPEIKLARRYGQVRDFIYIGRGVGFPIAMEGALKLKEQATSMRRSTPPAS